MKNQPLNEKDTYYRITSVRYAPHTTVGAFIDRETHTFHIDFFNKKYWKYLPSGFISGMFFHRTPQGAFATVIFLDPLDSIKEVGLEHMDYYIIYTLAGKDEEYILGPFVGSYSYDRTDNMLGCKILRYCTPKQIILGRIDKVFNLFN